jgi:hypothetical protein
MDPASIAQYINTTFAGVDAQEGNGDTFFIFDPDRNLPPERQTPFATLVTSDFNDTFSDLNRPGVFRLNIGVSKQTFQSLLGDLPADFPEAGGYDFAALDRLLPHPVYGRMHWLCVLSPSDATFETLRPLLAEAHARVADRYARRPVTGGG